VRSAVGPGNSEAPQEIIQRIFAARGSRQLRAAHDVDVDDGTAVTLDQRGEIGKLPQCDRGT
jgi:hypothetical protein